MQKTDFFWIQTTSKIVKPIRCFDDEPLGAGKHCKLYYPIGDFCRINLSRMPFCNLMSKLL
ncbi:MAG: hypothetical protein LRZ88_01325 [Candidatus Cloacimonetes bacterium]|nr:hypothetical protein [Candidatus Cloacimonadota bacterium]